nr:hypothetical protein [Candidatus Bathyarchaeota archaeon]
KLRRVARKYGYEFVTKLSLLPTSEGTSASNSTLDPHENNVEKRVDMPPQLGNISNSVTTLVALKEPHIDPCAHCNRTEVLHWQVETVQGEWGHVCQDCHALFSEIIETRRAN